MTTYRILSIDGGGIRGLLSLILLQRLEKGFPRWLDKTDLLAGTSTGGIVALGLAHGATVTELRRLYEERGKRIFDDSWWDDLCDLGKTRGADYKTKNLETEVRRLLGNAKLKDLDKRVLIPTFDLDNEKPEERSWAPKFFHNFPGEDSDGEQLAYKVALYTSAAPTYFPSVDGYIDGGVVANNPIRLRPRSPGYGGTRHGGVGAYAGSSGIRQELARP
jgi:patatin-like phospholipase/acyl hydrolase